VTAACIPAGISPKQREADRRDAQEAVDADLLPEEIVKLAWQRAESAGSPFDHALNEVTSENRRIIRQFQIERRRQRGGV
jgi:hypothetical protein